MLAVLKQTQKKHAKHIFTGDGVLFVYIYWNLQILDFNHG